MTCRDFEQALADLLNDQTPADPEAASAHVRACTACQDRMQKVTRLHEYLFRALAPAPSALADRVKAAVSDLGRNLDRAPERVRLASHRRFDELSAPTLRGALLRAWHGRRRTLLWAAGGLAAALLLTVTLVVSFKSPNLQPAPMVQRPSPPPRPPAAPPLEERPREIEKEPPKEPSPRRAPAEVPPEKPGETPPVPAPPEEKPAPPGEPKPAPKEEPLPPHAPPRETLPAVAELDDVAGEVYVISRGERKRVQAKAPLATGDAVESAGALSLATVRFKDATWLQLWGDTAVQDLVDPVAVPAGRGGKRATVAKGHVAADVAKQPAGRSLVLATPQGEARVVATVLRISVDPAATVIEVDEGRVEFKRAQDGRFVDVPAGHVLVAAPGLDLVARPMAQADKKKPKPPADVDPKKVDEAVKKGVDWLKGAMAIGRLKDLMGPNNTVRMDELVLLTFLHAGVPETDPDFQQLFKTMMETELRATYDVSLQAVILEEMHRVKYQARIVQCAQFLADNQAGNGQWSYGTPTPFVKGTPTGDARPEISSPGGRKTPVRSEPVNQREKPKVVKRVAVRKLREGPEHGDPSNSQYAALGLRACHDAGVVFPVEMVRLAEKSWLRSQEKDGGWRYGGDPATTGSMTAGAAGSLTIYHYILSEPWMKDEAVLSGLDWLAQNFSVTWNPGRPNVGPDNTGSNYYYYLYALERLGTLYGTETVGAHKWYPEGVKALLEAQQPGGVWQCRGVGTNQVWDTCFAILFLRRATRPLIDVESVDRAKKK